MKQKLTLLFRRLLCFLPAKLPQGRTAFKAWADDILEIYGLPNNDSTHFALAVAVLHANELAAYKSKEYFGRKLVKGAANEVAAAVIQELKAKQQAAQEEAAKKAQEAAQDEQKNPV